MLFGKYGQHKLTRENLQLLQSGVTLMHSVCHTAINMLPISIPPALGFTSPREKILSDTEKE